MTKKVLLNILKVTFSVLAICYVLSNIDFLLIKEAILSARVVFLIVALLFYFVSQFAGAHRLKLLFNQVPLRISSIENIKLYWLGLFYNLFLPGGIGGDGFKVYLLGKYSKTPIKKIIGAIIADRLSGLSIVLVFILVFIPIIDYHIPYKHWAWAAIPLVLLGFYLFLRFFNKSLRSQFFGVVLWSFVGQLLQLLAAVFILRSMGVEFNGEYENYLILFFISAIMGSIPITLGGIGAREMTFFFGAQHLGINQTYAVALSILFYAASAITALPGIMYTFNPSGIICSETTVEEAKA